VIREQTGKHAFTVRGVAVSLQLRAEFPASKLSCKEHKGTLEYPCFCRSEQQSHSPVPQASSPLWHRLPEDAVQFSRIKAFLIRPDARRPHVRATRHSAGSPPLTFDVGLQSFYNARRVLIGIELMQKIGKCFPLISTAPSIAFGRLCSLSDYEARSSTQQSPKQQFPRVFAGKTPLSCTDPSTPI
jgi:hypothetical protein